MTARSETILRDAVGWAAAAIVLAPFLTVTLTYRRALVVQAALVLGITLLLLALGGLRRGWRDRVAASRPVLLGVALYAAAALQGTVVALVRGNDLKLTAGQFLAMGLLPLAAIAGMGLSSALDWRIFATGLVGAVAAGTLVQGIVAGPAMIAHFPGPRLMLPNAVSVSGAAAMALLFALALTRSGPTSARVLAWVAAALTVALIFVSGIRSQWLVLPLGLACLFAIALGLQKLFSRRIALAWGTALVVVAGAAAVTAWWWTRPRPNLALGTLEAITGARDATATVRLPGGAVRVRGSITCRGSGNVYMRFRATGEETIASDRVVPLVVAGAAPSEFWIVHRPLPAEATLAVRLEDPSNLGCRMTSFAVEAIAPWQLAEVVGGLAGMLHRPPDPGSGSTPGVAAGDASVAFRVRETLAVVAAIKQVSWPWGLVGQGLGATFAFDTVGYDNRGNIVRYERPNYIHNFYLFLLFKLGVLGALAVLTALAIWVWTAADGARAATGRHRRPLVPCRGGCRLGHLPRLERGRPRDPGLPSCARVGAVGGYHREGREAAGGERRHRPPLHIADPRPDALT